jgi:hypothetical protein
MEATIRRLSIDNDNLHERVRKLTDRIERYERAFVEVVRNGRRRGARGGRDRGA